MAEVFPTNRLLRKRNSNLQKQLDVTMHLLSEEYRQTKERMYKDERDCGKFLQSLYSTVPGLQAYGQPDTRAMNRNSNLKERHYSMSVSVHSDGEEPHSPLDPPVRPKAPASSSSYSGKAAGSRPRSSTLEDGGAKTVSLGEASGTQTCGTTEGGCKPSTAERNSLIKKLRENNNFLPRPSTAGNQKKGAPSQAGNTDKPSSPNFKQQRLQSPSYGRGAYTEHDRFLHDRVLKKFVDIFDPETEARRVNLNTLAAPALVVEEDGNDAMDNTTTPKAKIPHPHVNMIKVNGEEFHLSKKPPGHRRVIWSANPHRKQRTVSAPLSARTERRTSSARQASPGLKPSSHTATTPRTKAPTPPAPSGKPDSCVQLLAPQKNLPVKGSRLEEDQSESSSESDEDTDEQTYSTVKPSQTMLKEPKAQPKLPERSKQQQLCVHQRKTTTQISTKSYCTTRPPPPQNHPREKNLTKRESSNHLQVPEAHHPPHHHPKPDGAGSHLNTLSQGPPPPPPPPARKHSITRPSSRFSDASDVTTPPVELWSKLMKAGLPGQTAKRPKTAPSKSDLSHRSMHAPRQTVAGILAQIENQKASTRYMISASKELQVAVKKLVPWEQPSVYDLDDW